MEILHLAGRSHQIALRDKNFEENTNCYKVTKTSFIKTAKGF